MKKRAGFTLTEFILALLALLVLGAILYPLFAGAAQAGRVPAPPAATALP